MKRLLCIILTLVCILNFSSCDLLNKFISTDPDANPTTTTPEKTPEATTPEKAPDETTSETTTPEPEETVLPDQEIYFSVQVVFQSGGIHRVEETFEVKESCTFNQLYTVFVEKHSLENYTIIPYLNGEPIDTAKTVYLQEGDYIYLEEYSGMPGEGPVCPHVWIDGWCERCGAVCEHSEWDDNRQCLVCGAMLGVDLIYIEFYMDGEYCGCTSTIEYTVGEMLMFQFWRSWEDLTSTYDVYVGDVLVTDQSYMVVESCNIYLVTRTYDYQ